MSDLIEAIRADREAGTPGPWTMSGSRGNRLVYCHQIDASALGGLAMVPYSDATDDEHRGSLADARRIARVPDMEAALLAADDVVEALSAYQSFETAAADAVDDGTSDGQDEYAAVFEAWERVEAAIAAYRAALASERGDAT